MKVKTEIERLIKIYGKEISDKLLKKEFNIIKTGNCTTTVEVDGEYFSIWMENSDENTNFYDTLDFGYDDILTKLLTKYSEIPEDIRSKVRDNIKEKQKEIEMETGLIKGIEKTQLSNDLFFKFNGVYGVVKFTGYNDNDWWTKYKPMEVKEDENITWQIDYEKMEAKYKPIKK